VVLALLSTFAWNAVRTGGSPEPVVAVDEPQEEREQSPEAEPKPEERSPEEMLAVIDGGSEVSYAAQLDRLEAVCTEDREDLSDIAVTARDVLADSGMTVSVAEVLGRMHGSIPPGAPVLQCDEIASAWATILLYGD